MAKNSPETIRKRNEKRRFLFDTIDHSSFPHEILRVCKDCGEEKLVRWASQFNMKGEPLYRTRCHECYREKENKRRRDNRRNETMRKLGYRLKRKQRAIDALGGACSRCGFNACIKALTFHHRDPSEKEGTIANMLDQSWAAVEKELRKCVLLCFNCHMIVHCEQDKEAQLAELGLNPNSECQSH